MQLFEGIETRRSCRAFRSTPIPKEIIERVLELAKKSPSYTNTQPWEVAVVGGNKKEELSKILHEMSESDVTPNPDLALPKVYAGLIETPLYHFSWANLAVSQVRNGSSRTPSLDSIHRMSPLSRAAFSLKVRS